jgi:hypothetical protein
VWNLVALWLMLLWATRRYGAGGWPVGALWIAGLILYRKESGAYFEASPWAFSIPVALAGWWMWGTGRRTLESALGAFLLTIAIVIWPVHLFPAAGVGLVTIWSRWRQSRFWYLVLFCGIGAGAVWFFRNLVPGGADLAGMQLIPDDLHERYLLIGTYIATVGSNVNGPLVGLGAAGLLAVFLFLCVYGRRHAGPLPAGDLIGMGAGVTLGAAAASWFLYHPSYSGRLFYLATLIVVPVSVVGLRELGERFPRQRGLSPALWRLGLGGIWLSTILASGVVTAGRQERWNRLEKPVVDALAAGSVPRQRVWATPPTYRKLVLGKLPLFGFLGHRRSGYYSAPSAIADSLAGQYHDLETYAGEDVEWRFRSAGADWALLDRKRDASLPVTGSLSRSLQPAFADSFYILYRIPPPEPR